MQAAGGAELDELCHVGGVATDARLGRVRAGFEWLPASTQIVSSGWCPLETRLLGLITSPANHLTTRETPTTWSSRDVPAGVSVSAKRGLRKAFRQDPVVKAF